MFLLHLYSAPSSKITNCQFIDIFCTETAFYDGASSSTVYIENSIIHINGGGFYSNGHSSVRSINIHNLSIVINQVETDITKAIFVFEENDDANMSEIAVVYIYNASDSCQYDGIKNNSNINASCTLFSCKNPMMFLNNIGKISIYNIMVKKVGIAKNENKSAIQQIYVQIRI